MASVFQSRKGRWTAQVNLGGKRRSRTFSTKTDAARWARREEAGRDAGRVSAPGRTTIGELVDAHLNNTTDPSRSKAASLAMIRDRLGRVPLAKIDAQTFLRFIKDRQADPSSPGSATLGQDLGYVHTVLSYGGAALDMDTSAALASLARARKVLHQDGQVSRPAERDRRPTPRELEQIEEHMTSSPRRAWQWDLVLFLTASAARLGEACSLTWDDVDSENRVMTIRQRKHPSKAEKRNNDQRVPLMRGHFHHRGELIDPIDVIARQPRRDDRVFPRNPDSVSAAFTRAVRACGIEDLHLHDLRHHGVSLLFEAGLDIMRVAMVSGHRDLQMLKRYTNLKASEVARVEL